MKAVQIDEYGGPEVLRYRENVQEPEVAANKLLIDIHAATVNPVDWKIMSGGRQKQMPLTMPFVLGVDL
ncbi:MAG: NADP-dependent oxidoreductase, partial [Rhodospirillaceae bacterium]